MLTVYLACLLFGGVLLAVSLFGGGGDADADLGGDADASGFHADAAGFDADAGDASGFHADAAGFDADAGDASDFHAADATDIHDVSDHPGGTRAAAAAQFLSFRNLVFFLAFFGMTGSTLTLLRIPPLLTGGTAAAMGAGAATMLTRVMEYLRRTESGQVMNTRELEGLQAQVLVGLSREREGKINVETDERSLALLAAVAEESSREEFAAGERVVIVRIDDGVAQVCEEDFVH